MRSILPLALTLSACVANLDGFQHNPETLQRDRYRDL